MPLINTWELVSVIIGTNKFDKRLIILIPITTIKLDHKLILLFILFIFEFMSFTMKGNGLLIIYHKTLTGKDI